MNKEPLFRAKSLETDDWVFGHYYMDDLDSPKHLIKPVLQEPVEIDPDTLCEFTGMFDNGGQRIFQYDIILGDAVVLWKGAENLNDPSKHGFYGINLGKHPLYAYEESDDFTVTGNVIDNPELAKLAL